MKTYLECLSCIVKFSLDALNRVTADETIHEEIMRQVLQKLAEVDYRLTSPEISTIVFKLMQDRFGAIDPYFQAKKDFNQFCLKLLPELQKIVRESDKPFETAIRLAIAGNIIDMGANHRITSQDIMPTVRECLTAELYDQETVQLLAEKLDKARKIMILGDNAGEIVFDQLLLDVLDMQKVTYVVKGAPILNDATMEDAVDTGLTQKVRVIDNGSGYPGTVMQDCREDFRKEFYRADVVITKGQANYETLSDIDRNLFNILKVKCPIVGRHIGVPAGSCVIKYKKL